MGEERRIEDTIVSKRLCLFVAHFRKAKAAPLPRRPCFNWDWVRKGIIWSTKEWKNRRSLSPDIPWNGCLQNNNTKRGIYLYYLGKNDVNFMLRLQTRARKWITSQIFHFTLILLTWRIWWASNNARRWQMGWNTGFKGLKSDRILFHFCNV